MDRELLDAQALVGHLVPKGSMFWFLATHRAEVFLDEEFADLFPSGRGRPSIPAPVAAAILTLQSLYDLSDAETAEAARCDLRWKVATGMALDDKGFHPSTLTYWRQRLVGSARPHRINEAVKRVVEETGILAGRRRRVVDSTILADAVATQDTITQLVAAVRRVAREVPGAAAQIQAVCSGHDYSTPGKPQIDWEDPQAKDALVSALVNDANALVAALEGAGLDEQQQSAVALLALVAGQDVEPAEGSDGTDGRWRIARKVAEDRVISTVDPEARHTRKSPEARRDGYRAHLAADPETGIITDEKLTRAAGQENSDPAVAEEFLTAGAGGDPLAWYGDSAYGTGDLRDAMEKAGHQAVIKPKPLQAPVQGGFTIDDFTVDEKAGMVTCPAGHTVALSRTRAAQGLHGPPAQRGTRRRPGRHLAGTPAQAPLPRHRKEPRLAQAPYRRAEPAPPDREGAGLPGRRLGAGHLSRPARHALKADPARWLAVSQTAEATGRGPISAQTGWLQVPERALGSYTEPRNCLFQQAPSEAPPLTAEVRAGLGCRLRSGWRVW